MMETISIADQQILDSLQKAVAEALERKKRLGQYAVVWQDGRPVMIGGENTDHEQKMDAFTVDDKIPPIPKQRRPHPEIAGKGRTLGDLIDPVVDQDDWKCLE
ncbi:MAG: hypothetical protein H7839_00565 [Magnetococcus sp. YQC-5]